MALVPQKHRAEILEVRALGPHHQLVRAQLEEADTIRFLPGQWAHVTIPIDGEEIPNFRAYFLDGMPETNTGPGILANEVRFTVAHQEKKPQVLNFSAGEKIAFWGPFGRFVPPERHKTHMLLLAKGIGILPYINMLNEFVRRGEDRKVLLIWELERPSDYFFEEDHKKWSDHFSTFHSKFTLTENTDGWEGSTADLTSIVSSRVKNVDNIAVYFAGDASTAEMLCIWFRGKGLPDSSWNEELIG